MTIDILMTLMTAFSDEPGLIDSLLGEELFLSAETNLITPYQILCVNIDAADKILESAELITAAEIAPRPSMSSLMPF